MGGDTIGRTIYVDVLIGVNIIINYFILKAVTKFTKIIPKTYRIILGSLFGAVSALIIILPPLPFFINWCIKLIISFIIILITFGYHNTALFFKNTILFYGISFCFCGLMLFVWFIFMPKGLYIKNSIVYFNLSPIVMIFTTLIAYFVIQIIMKIMAKSVSETRFCKVKIISNGNSCEFYGKTDTGNTLYEPFSHAPVIVVNEKAVKSIIENEFQKLLDSEYDNLDISRKYRLIPFHSVGGKGLLPSFLPDKIYINNHVCQQKIYIAVCKDTIVGTSVEAMINPEIINSAKEGINNDIFKSM